MTPARLSAEVVADRVSWIREMLAELRRLPLGSLDDFVADSRTPAAAESYLRRALEALLDLGRHVLAKGFGRAATEYRQIAEILGETGVIGESEAALLREMAGYRNRLVHFYDKVSHPELYQICADRSGDIEAVLDAILAWIRATPGSIDRTI